MWIASQGTLVFFGGMLPITADTLQFDAAARAWAELSTASGIAGPGARCHHTLVSDGGAENIFMFGGFSFFGRFNDTWRYDADAARWTLVEATGSVPAKRCLHSAAYVTSRQEMLVYGGISGAGVSSDDFFADTHILDLHDGEWSLLGAAGPGKLAGAVTVYASNDDAVYLWGGKQVDTYPSTLWRFDVQTRVWEQIETTGDLPRGREDPTYFWDDQQATLYVFTGRNDTTSEVLLDDAYALDVAARQWRPLDTSGAPAPRWRGTVVFDPDSSVGYLFGGWRDFGGLEAFNDTWRYDPATNEWTEVTGGGVNARTR